MAFDPNEARDPAGKWMAGLGNVAFHGTTHDFAKFKPGDPTEFMLDRALGPHFAKDPEIANSFTVERINGRDVGAKEGGRIIPVVLPPDERFIEADQPLYDRARLPDGSRDPAIPEWNARKTDQNAIEAMVAKEGFTKDPSLLERYLEQSRKLPAEQASQLARGLIAGKTASLAGADHIGKEGEDQTLDRFLNNYGGRPYNDADRAALVNMAKQSWMDKGYAGIKYTNTSPMENATATNPTSYIVFDPDKDVKPLYGDQPHPETDKYISAFTTGGQDYSAQTAQASREQAQKIAGNYKPLDGLPQVRGVQAGKDGLGAEGGVYGGTDAQDIPAGQSCAGGEDRSSIREYAA